MAGLLRGMARTAAVAGTATVVSGRVQRRQAEKFAERDAQIAATRGAGYYQGVQSVQAPPPQYAAPAPQPAAPAPAAGASDMIQQLKDLAALKEQGILTEEEFATQKARVLGM